MGKVTRTHLRTDIAAPDNPLSDAVPGQPTDCRHASGGRVTSSALPLPLRSGGRDISGQKTPPPQIWNLPGASNSLQCNIVTRILKEKINMQSDHNPLPVSPLSGKRGRSIRNYAVESAFLAVL